MTKNKPLLFSSGIIYWIPRSIPFSHCARIQICWIQFTGLFRVLSTMKSLHPNTKLLTYRVNIFPFFKKLLYFKLYLLLKMFQNYCNPSRIVRLVWNLSSFIDPSKNRVCILKTPLTCTVKWLAAVVHQVLKVLHHVSKKNLKVIILFPLATLKK